MQQQVYTIPRLPTRTVLLYAAFFAIAFWFYSVLWVKAPVMAPDSPSYLRAAQDFSAFRFDRLNPRPPGYPLFLVLTGSSQEPTRALFYSSLALHFASVWLAAVVLYALGMTGAWLNLFALLLILPPYVEYAAYVLSESLSEFLLVLAFSSLVFWFLRGRGSGLLILSGTAIAYAGLTRPTYQALAFAIAGFLFVVCRAFSETSFKCRSVIRASLILLTASILFIGGFSLFNYLKFDFFGIYPMTGLNLSNRTARVLERLPDEYAAERETLIKARNAYLIERDGDHTVYNYYWWAIPDLAKITGLKEIPELSKYMLSLNLLLIKEAPLNYLQEVLSSFSSYWLPSATRLANMDSIVIQTLWAAMQLAIMAVFILQLVVILGLAIFSFSQRFLLDKSKLKSSFSVPAPGHIFAYFLASTIVLYNAVLTCLIEVGDSRYRVPTEPLIIFMCFLGLYLWQQLIIGFKRPLLGESGSMC